MRMKQNASDEIGVAADSKKPGIQQSSTSARKQSRNNTLSLKNQFINQAEDLHKAWLNQTLPVFNTIG
jgi:hypothetical protein